MSADFDLPGRIVIVTGGARGIGAAIAVRLAEAGATVLVADRDEAEASRTAAAIETRGLAAHPLPLDVTSRDSVSAAVEAVAHRFGAPHVLVNNAGIVRNAPAVDTAPEDWSAVIDVNLNGVFRCAQGFGRLMLEAGRGSVVNISSMCGEIVVHPQPQVAYNAAKAGVNLLTKSLAVEWAPHGLRVNAVAPGYTATELTLAGRSNPEWFGTWMRSTPMGRLGEPREIANAVLFLASDAASFITGTVLTVDGGYTAL
ncbi:SDR family oxidoreductase [Aureimonas sp. Leaf324]|jgi:NAD(P)-dependent dehydrogenase (short-subunit alcohol dehydrogenase family)|uniref:SDR family NAD(P)-dependent oxidoreductase n=1 Tax=Aureimonas sp. Leaf324 TaxID=1736336 RepID=UPI000700C67D|nr:SDR family oxidoreductase [Aureimonas sp. Leaf324]KQQ79635.1 3-oxoacyl-ACP reductase [Aureimonas sp. Leaf324]